MADRHPIEEPSPTIVGPRPPEGSSGRKLNIPRGLEQLLTLGGLNAEWQAKVLADPLAAAEEAGISLGESEKAILRSVPPSALAGMVQGLAKSEGRGALSTLAGGAAKVAAAALLAANVAGSGCVPVTGIRPDRPASRPVGEMAAETAPVVAWSGSLDAALAQARQAARPVMAVFLHPKPGDRVPKEYPPTKGLTADLPQPELEARSQRVCLSESAEVLRAMRDSNLIPVRVAMPVRPPGEPTREQEARYTQEMERWLASLRKGGLLGTSEEEERKLVSRRGELQNRLPAVVFFAPDGAVLRRLVQPVEEKELVAALVGARTTQPASRPDIPVTRGIQPDVPRQKN